MEDQRQLRAEAREQLNRNILTSCMPLSVISHGTNIENDGTTVLVRKLEEPRYIRIVCRNAEEAKKIYRHAASLSKPEVDKLLSLAGNQNANRTISKDQFTQKFGTIVPIRCVIS